MEVGENGQILEAVGLGGAIEVACLVSFSYFCLGSVTASEELTSKKPHKIAKYLPKEKKISEPYLSGSQ